MAQIPSQTKGGSIPAGQSREPLACSTLSSVSHLLAKCYLNSRSFTSCHGVCVSFTCSYEKETSAARPQFRNFGFLNPLFCLCLPQPLSCMLRYPVSKFSKKCACGCCAAASRAGDGGHRAARHAGGRAASSVSPALSRDGTAAAGRR